MKTSTNNTRINGSKKGGKGRASTGPVIDAAFVTQLRKDLDLNQADFWGPLGITQSGGSRYESGRKIPSPARKLIWAVHVAGHVTYAQLAQV